MTRSVQEESVRTSTDNVRQDVDHVVGYQRSVASVIVITKV